MKGSTHEVVLITGCSSGIGRALAADFKRRGYRVFASARSAASVEALAAAGFEAVALDITDDGSVKAAIAHVLEHAGRIDYLVNNAGHSLFGPLAETPLAAVRQLVETNLVAQLRMCQAVIPVMAAQRSGCIVNVGSVMGLVTTPFVGAYAASKAGLHMLSEALRMEIRPLGIDVVVVQPGAVQSQVALHGSEHSQLERYDDPSSLYFPLRDQIRLRSQASQDQPTDTDDFARQVLDRLLVTRPPRVIRTGKGSTLLGTLSHLPGALRDRLFSHHFQMRRLRPFTDRTP